MTEQTTFAQEPTRPDGPGMRVVIGALLGALTSLPVIALSWLGAQVAELPFVPFDLFDAVGRVLPGPIITFGIDLIVTIVRAIGVGPTDVAAKLAEQMLAIGGPIVGGAVLGALLGYAARRMPGRLAGLGALGGLVLLGATLAAEVRVGWPDAGPLVSALWLALLLVGWGWLLGRMVRTATQPAMATAGPGRDRRSFLAMVAGGAVAVMAGALGLGALLREEETPTTVGAERPDPSLTTGPNAAPPAATLEARVEPAPGTRPEITPTADFYHIDINTTPPEVDGDAWRLEVGGLVGRPLTLTLDEIREMPSVSHVATLSCISNRIGGDLIGTSRFTGVRLRDVLAEAELESSATHLFVEAVDGFYETVQPEDMDDPRTLLVYEMNGQPLTPGHGFPLRIYIPDRYGMKQPKWIRTLTAIDEARPGYWVERNWSREARPHVVSMIDNVAMSMMVDDEAVLPVGGIAWAGARGISKVEVQVDDGPWQEATLREPPLSQLAWVQWRLDWPYEEGRHTFRVRAVDGEGQMQVLEPSGARPDGATGVHELMTTV